MGILNRSKKTKQEQEPVVDTKTQKAETSSELSKMFGVDTTGVIVKPLISEKAATLTSGNQYVFVVRKNANRIQVRNAIKQMYGVTPISVNVLNVRGKKVRFGRRIGKRSNWKKAIVTLPAGQTINVYEGV